MKNNRIWMMILFVFWGMASIGVWIKSSDEFSSSERRPMEKFPEVSLESFLSGEFMSDFEKYVTDQFPFRDGFRSLKAGFTTKVLGQKDVHDIYVVDGYVSQMEYPLNGKSVERALNRFSYVFDQYLKDKDISMYYAVIPDKNYYLAEPNGYLSMDYEKIFEMLRQGMEELSGEQHAKEIIITDLLSIDDYYKTDIHWKQEKLLDVSERLLNNMGHERQRKYKLQMLDVPFYGVYAGQSGLAVDSETIYYYTNDVLSDSIVFDYETKTYGTIYDMDKAKGRDPYEMFLSGSKSILTIENPNAASNEELVMFRDSFGSSIVPLMVEAYAKITLVDIRYIQPELLGKYIQFENQDILFLYSTSVLNNGDTIK